jgi:hypothetical protein
MASKIPVFVSAPSDLSADQQQSYDRILELLDRENLERRALGRSEYPSDYPLKEVHMIARRCAGGMILGYSQSIATELHVKPGTRRARTDNDIKLATPWNQLEAGILFSLRLPLMVFREDGVTGGIFDIGTTDVFVNRLPIGKIGPEDNEQIIFSMQTWVARVREHYRRWD